jgi:hypothetical protein
VLGGLAGAGRFADFAGFDESLALRLADTDADAAASQFIWTGTAGVPVAAAIGGTVAGTVGASSGGASLATAAAGVVVVGDGVDAAADATTGTCSSVLRSTVELRWIGGSLRTMLRVTWPPDCWRLTRPCLTSA